MSLAPKDLFSTPVTLLKEIRSPVISIRLRKHQITFHLYLISYLYQNMNMKIRALSFEPFLSCSGKLIYTKEHSVSQKAAVFEAWD